MPDQNIQLIEQLRDELLKRARAIVELGSQEPYGVIPQGPEGLPAKAPKERNYLQGRHFAMMAVWRRSRNSVDSS